MWECCNIGQPSQTQSRQNSLADNIHYCCQIPLEMYKEHRNDVVVLGGKRKKIVCRMSNCLWTRQVSRDLSLMWVSCTSHMHVTEEYHCNKADAVIFLVCPGTRSNIGYPSEMQVIHKSSEISFVYNLCHTYPIVLKRCVRCKIAKNLNNWYGCYG